LQHDWAAQLTALAPESLLREVRRQSRPRRWPWQPKTIRDLVNERSADLLELAADRSAELAELLAERRDEMAVVLRRQSQPRRFPWQQKTARDYVDARMSDLTERAAERSAELAALAATRRDNVMQTLARQSRPRRFPWQTKTARDLAEERVAALVDQATSRGGELRSQADDLLAQAGERRQQLQKQFERESRPRRFPWQTKTARDLAEERVAALVDQATSRGGELRSTLASAPVSIGTAASEAVDSVRSTADSTAAAVRETASDLSKRIGDSTDSAASTVRTAAKAPAKAISRKVESGKRTVRWSVRLAKFSFWALLFGAVVGVLYSPRSGLEVRRDIRFNINKLLDMILPVE
jgi:gas vesicle protein